MKEIIVHAGFHKTGSSSIQNTLSRIEMDNVEYLDWGHLNHSVPFQSAFSFRNVGRGQAGALPEQVKDAMQARSLLETSLAAVSKDRAILSAEDFSSGGARPGLQQLHEILCVYADRIRVIAYVRPVGSNIVSDFQQCTRSGLKVPFGRNPDYLARIRMLDAVFGRENVELAIFSKQTLLQSDVVLDFASRIGVDLGETELKRHNESFALEPVAIARCSVLFGKVGVNDRLDIGLNHFAANKLQSLGKTKFGFSSRALEKLVLPLKKEIGFIEQRIGGKFPAAERSADGVDSDQDLLEVAVGCENQIIELIRDLTELSENASMIIERDLNEISSEPLAEVRVASCVDTIKRIRLGKVAHEQAA